jgi:sulfur dioxygenase
MLVFRQLFDPASSTYSYLLGDAASGEAVLIDPVFDLVRRDAALLRELGLTLVASLDTHVHADHVTGAWLLKERCGSQVMVARASGAEGADRYLQDGDRVAFGARFLEVRSTPGHTAGCVTYVLDDQAMAFTGDCLLIRGSGRTDFQQGDPREMYRSVRNRILTLPPACLLYPAHDYRGLTVTSVEEERRFNPRLGGEIPEADFVGYMTNLGLPHPKLIDIAVPANLKCGKPAAISQPADPAWASLTFTFAGIFEINPAGLEECIADVQVVDVRERDEYDGPIGRIAGSRWIPLGELAARAGELAKECPIVAVCRSGARSAHAVSMLSRMGFPHVANLAGGMLRWHAEGLPVEGGRE